MQTLIIILMLLNTINSFYINTGKRFFSKVFNTPETVVQCSDTALLSETARQIDKKYPIQVTSVKVLQQLIVDGVKIQDLDVRGNTSMLLNTTIMHPVLKTMYDRIESGSMPGNRTDGLKIAIAIEGGGMRGCVAGGMVTALCYLGLQDSIDCVYGSSAGALVGTYFISRQVPYTGPEIYYDVLTTSGPAFLDMSMLLRSCGLGLLDLRLNSLASMWRDRMGKPVLNLDYLLGPVVRTIKPLNWTSFWDKQTSGQQTLHVVCSGLTSEKSIALSAGTGNFETLSGLCRCIKASMLLPGITGDVVRLKDCQLGSNLPSVMWPEYSSQFDSTMTAGSEPLADAQLFEPVPYRTAEREGATHVLAFRTRPDGLKVTGRLGLLDKMITFRFLGRKLGLPKLVKHMHTQMHKLVYAQDILRLNAESQCFDDSMPADSDAFLESAGAGRARLACVALPVGSSEIGRLELSRPLIFESIREGFAAAYEVLVAHNASMRGRGLQIAKEIWPDEILARPPVHLELQQRDDELPLTQQRQQPQQEVAATNSSTSFTSSLPQWVRSLPATVFSTPPDSKRRAIVRTFQRFTSTEVAEEESDS